MSVYIITKDENRIHEAQNELKSITNSITTIDHCGWHLMIAGRKSTPNTIKEYPDGLVYVEGTIFDDRFWNLDFISEFSSKEELLQCIIDRRRRVFGQYSIIVISDKGIEVLSDPIGIINTYYCDDDDSIAVSNDSLLLAKIFHKSKINKQAAWEFMIRETNIGNDTLFEGITRLGLGEKLGYSDKLSISRIYEYCIERVSSDDFFSRIEEYFKCLKNYKGKISVDISAGWDTRCVVSSVYGTGKSYKYGFGSNNVRDGGIDNEISQIIVERIGLPFRLFTNRQIDPRDEYVKKLILHGTSTMRSHIRSKRFAYLFEYKFEACDLSLSGHGGEVLRADTDNYVNGAGGANAINKNGISDYDKNIEEKYNNYPVPKQLNSEMTENWFYAVDFMRNWGSGLLQMSNLFGETLDPFMDWYLISAILGFDIEELKDGKLSQKIIEHFSGELFSDLPVNDYKKNAWIKRKIKTFKWIIGKICEKVSGIIQRTKNKDIISQMPSELRDSLGISYVENGLMEELLYSIIDIYKYVRE